jgi:hypothetical protein
VPSVSLRPRSGSCSPPFPSSPASSQPSTADRRTLDSRADGREPRRDALLARPAQPSSWPSQSALPRLVTAGSRSTGERSYSCASMKRR